MEQELKSVRYQSEKYPRLTTLINRVNEVSLWEAHEKQKRGKAVGVDGVTKDTYDMHLIENLRGLVARMKSFEYIPQPVRRTHIPKLNGKMRPLGIPSYEDKLVQSVMADVLNDVYEPRFLDCSYGFRPGRKAHDVVRFIDQTIMFKHVNYVLEADIKGFFDNLDQKWLVKFLEHDIADKNFIRYIVRFLKAGVMENGALSPSERGTPQGGLVSPVLANVFLHYVLDTWVEHWLKKQFLGEVYYVRYADDFLLLFQVEKEANRAMELLKERLAKFGLELAEDKTRVLPIGRHKGTKEKFDFLGFTFLNARTKAGKYILLVHSCEKKLKDKRQKLKAWLRTRINKPLFETLKLIRCALNGHANYYGVTTNYAAVSKFWEYTKESTLRMLRRRGQKKPITWAKFRPYWDMIVGRPSLRVDIWKCEPKMI